VSNDANQVVTLTLLIRLAVSAGWPQGCDESKFIVVVHSDSHLFENRSNRIRTYSAKLAPSPTFRTGHLFWLLCGV